MENKSSGTHKTLCGSTSIIAKYPSKALVLLKQKNPLSLGNLRKIVQPHLNTSQIPARFPPQTTTTHSMLATYYKKQKPESLQLSRNLPVVPVPQVPKEPHHVQQVRFLEAPNFQYQKKVHFLLHPCPKPKPKKNHYPRPLPALRDPHKPLQYPPQPSRRHQQYQKETPEEYHHRFLLTHHVQENQAHHRDHLVPQHRHHPQLSWQEMSPP